VGGPCSRKSLEEQVLIEEAETDRGDSLDYLSKGGRKDNIMDVNYENGEVKSGYKKLHIEASGGKTERIQTSQVKKRTGVYGVFHQLYKSDPLTSGSKRCETSSIKLRQRRINSNTTMFYGMSIQLDEGFQFDGPWCDILVQWKGFGSHPFLSIQQKHTGLYLRVNSHPSETFVPTRDTASLVKSGHVLTETVEKGVWYDFIFHVVWDYKTDGVGMLEVEMKKASDEDYIQVVKAVGPNMYNKTGYLKWGIYKPNWKREDYNGGATERLIYHDNVRIGTSRDAVIPSIPSELLHA